MLTLLSPAGLWALTALGLPLALHLWRRPPRTVRLGTLRHLERLTRRRSRDMRWHELLLLAVRLLLLVLLALMLTRPHWRPASLDRPQNWILLDPSAVPGGESLTRLSAWQKAGYETHFLAAGFPKGGATGDSLSSRRAPDLWSLLREADAGLPAGSKLAVFTPGRLASLRGDRPALSGSHVEWMFTPERASAGLSQAPQSPAASLAVLLVHDTAHAEDARYLDAAVRAVGEVSRRTIVLTEITAAKTGAVAIQPAWVFWLADDPVPQTVSDGTANVITEAPANPSPDLEADWIVPLRGAAGAEALITPIRLWRRAPAPADPSAAVLWVDGFGRPLLTRSREGRHERWRFYSRFAPAWTDLPRTTALPAWLRSLLLPETSVPLLADPTRDLRLADPAQLPMAAAQPGTTPVVLPLHRDTPGLQGWCWLGAAILFGLERLLSLRRPFPRRSDTALDVTRAAPAIAR